MTSAQRGAEMVFRQRNAGSSGPARTWRKAVRSGRSARINGYATQSHLESGGGFFGSTFSQENGPPPSDGAGRFGGATRRPKDPVSGRTGPATKPRRLRTRRWSRGAAAGAATQWQQSWTWQPCDSSGSRGAGPGHGGTDTPSSEGTGRREGIVAGISAVFPRGSHVRAFASGCGGSGPVEA